MARTFLPGLGHWTPAALGAGALLAIAFVLGGASRLHEPQLALVTIAALPLLVCGGTGLLRTEGVSRYALLFLATLVALPLIQLVPLPAAIWTALPGRDEPALALQLAGIAPDWTPLSLTPEKTWRSFLALLPPVAMFLATLAFPTSLRLRMVLIVLAGTVIAIAVGAAQLASGGDRLYPWPTTDAGNLVGFFANRNHMATLCLVALPFAAVLGGRSLNRGAGGQLAPWVAVLFIGLVVVAIGAIRSRTGILLLPPVLAASLIGAWVAAGRGRPRPLLLGIVGATVLAAVAVSVFALDPILDRFDATSAGEARFENWPVVAQAADSYLPVGSGLGSFDAVFRSVEPLETLDSTYFNQAHNDYLETWLEAGLLGAALIIAFLIWFGLRSWAAWRARPSQERDLQRAASIAIAVVLVHSGVDYPLRTETIAVIFAMCCVLLEMAHRSDDAIAESDDGRRRRRRRSS